jgi:hypothetical protein
MTEQSPNQPTPSTGEKPIADATKLGGVPAPEHIVQLKESLRRETDGTKPHQTPIGSIPQNSVPKHKQNREDVLG